ncbi:general secretion pathway protein GspK [Duganella sp. FT80W]|uniref:Type II secretion system protein K n=1 Tax=Duganella guangzhouensis TaxID=2666084 RepID=A0A6I2KZM6_9BURK|nr:type II secretion system minor pseudopilin GspK [Duganella guangzhouensis]MRW91002.1 general secretion pathway protein GspK [Duganella guangzhouensis]
MRFKRQRGVAVVTALLLTTLAVTIVASLFWQQQVQVRSMENQRLRLQTRWILRGALDLSRLVLNQDVMDSPLYTPLSGVWATPLEETRLDDYVERERLQGENYAATLSGRMEDAQSRYNLSNLATGTTVNTAELAVFERLLTNLKLDTSQASAVASLVASSQATSSTSSGSGNSSDSETMGMVRADDLLAVSGFTPAAIETLRNYVIVLPTTAVTPLNVNTAPAEVLAALVPSLSLSDAAAMVSSRKTVYYRQKTDFTSLSQMSGKTVTASWDVRSDYFLAYSRVRLDRASLDTVSLLYRPGKLPATTVAWIREY